MKSPLIMMGVFLVVGLITTRALAEIEISDTGKVLFTEKCSMCHRAMGMGTWQLEQRLPKEVAWLENRTDLNSEFVRYVVRNGWGIMFSMSRAEVSDDELDFIAEYLNEEVSE